MIVRVLGGKKNMSPTYLGDYSTITPGAHATRNGYFAPTPSFPGFYVQLFQVLLHTDRAIYMIHTTIDHPTSTTTSTRQG